METQMAVTVLPPVNDTPATIEFTDLPAKVQQLIIRHDLRDDWRAIYAHFAAPLGTIAEWKRRNDGIVIADRHETDKMREAGDIWAAVREVWTAVDSQRKAIKDPFLRKGQLIDGIANIIKDEIAPLLEDLKAKRDYAKILEQKEESERGANRRAALLLHGPTALDAATLGKLSDEQFTEMLESARQSALTRKLEESDRRERLERELEDERARRRATEERLAEERRKLEESERELAEQKRIEAEAAERERAAEAARRAEEERLAQAPDREKLLILAQRISAITLELPTVATESAAWELERVKTRLTTTAEDLRKFGAQGDAE
ncbi:MAG TPA: hypothetical protein PKO33_05015 [Pyrinomonadaceae bacterium]|nr:hypothetical protein [Pyrinomonadaceae bacterium]